MHGHQFTDASRGRRSRIGRGLDGADVTSREHRH
jgi:hypothetical protein